jgi:hypothetical protein
MPGSVSAGIVVSGRMVFGEEPPCQLSWNVEKGSIAINGALVFNASKADGGVIVSRPGKPSVPVSVSGVTAVLGGTGYADRYPELVPVVQRLLRAM